MRKKNPAIPRSAYPVDEGCYKLGIGRTSLYAMAQAGEIRLIKIAGRTLVPHSEIERLTRVDQAA
jgi:hypothetical protein